MLCIFYWILRQISVDFLAVSNKKRFCVASVCPSLISCRKTVILKLRCKIEFRFMWVIFIQVLYKD
jgi:hypothetical protein